MITPLPNEEPPLAEERLIVPIDPAAGYIQCQHVALGDMSSESAQNWRRGRASRFNHCDPSDIVSENCLHRARFAIAGLPMCRRHAAMVILDECLERGI